MFCANNLKLRGAMRAYEAHIHYRRFTIIHHLMYFYVHHFLSHLRRYFASLQTYALPYPSLATLRGSGSMSEWADGTYWGQVQRSIHITILKFCVRELGFSELISPKSIQLPEITRRQESLKHFKNYGTTSTCFVVNKEKKIL